MTTYKLADATRDDIIDAILYKGIRVSYLSHMDQAIDCQLKRNLRVHKTTNIMRDDTGIVSQLVSVSDREPIEDLSQAIEWYFLSEIFNSCSRLSRGCSA